MAVANTRWRRELLIHSCLTIPLSFFPIVCLYFMRGYDGNYPTIPEMLANGGVLSTAITLASEALSRLLTSGNQWLDIKIPTAACSLGVVIFGSIFYALRYARQPANSTLFVDLCFFTLFLGIAVSTFAKFLPEDDK